MRLFESEYSGRLFQKVLELAGVFSSAGGRALLVGGAVRDALMGRQVKDFDLEIHDLPAERVLELLRQSCEIDAVGMSFGVIKVKHFDLDISLPRRENKTGAGHRGFLVEVDPRLSLPEAAARRDFTVNAIMYDPLSCELLDPHGGAADIERKILRHVSGHFAEDPLRVLRGMQFAARLGFSFAPETLDVCKEIDQNELPVERIGTEWEKLLLQGVKCSAGLDFLQQCRWIRFYPELEKLAPGKWGKTLALLDSCAASRSGERQKDLILMTGALISGMSPGDGASFCQRLWNRHDLIKKALLLAESLREYEMEEYEITPGRCRRISCKLNGMELFIVLLRCSGFENAALQFKEQAEKYRVLAAPPLPIVSGKECLRAGCPPGPEMGKYLKLCFEAQLDGEFDDLQSGLKYLKSLLANR